jgi:hypothetical protein
MAVRALAQLPSITRAGQTESPLLVRTLEAHRAVTLNACLDYGDNGLKHFDKVVALAEKKGIKLVVTLTNNWADYGGMDVYK